MRGPVLAIVATFIIAACGEPPPPQLIETSQIKPLLVEGNTLDGRRIAVDGYIDVDDGPESLGGAAMAYTLTSRPRGLGDDLILFQADLGKGANEIDLPVLSSESMPALPNAPQTLLVDLKNGHYQDGAGAVFTLDDKTRVTGRLMSGSGQTSARSPTGLRYRPMLTDVTLKRAP